MNGSFLRASLFTSVVAFGVAALVMGLGVVFGMVGYAITRRENLKATEPSPDRREPLTFGSALKAPSRTARGLRAARSPASRDLRP